MVEDHSPSDIKMLDRYLAHDYKVVSYIHIEKDDFYQRAYTLYILEK